MNAIERLKAIFSQALEKKAGPERDGFLAEVCGGDSGLRHQVESLLLAQKGAGGTTCFLRAASLAELDAQRGLK